LQEYTGENDKPIYVSLEGEVSVPGSLFSAASSSSSRLDIASHHEGLQAAPDSLPLSAVPSSHAQVFDVSEASAFYGKDGVYHIFAGRDATKAFAKTSLEEADLDNTECVPLSCLACWFSAATIYMRAPSPCRWSHLWTSLTPCPLCVHSLSDLTYSQKEALQEWVFKYKYMKSYPIVGRLIRPPTDLELTPAQLKAHNGTQQPPDGYADPPIYVAIKGQVSLLDAWRSLYHFCSNCTFRRAWRAGRVGLLSPGARVTYVCMWLLSPDLRHVVRWQGFLRTWGALSLPGRQGCHAVARKGACAKCFLVGGEGVLSLSPPEQY
jgi:predicted heme/steroid binding protein